jgi:hypothetical protein
MDNITRPIEIDNDLDLQIRGFGKLKFLGLSVYDIHLWAPIDLTQQNFNTKKFALSLTYYRKIEGALIADLTLVEMRKFVQGEEIELALETRWLAHMRKAFPNVSAGDCLTGINVIQNNRREVHFYCNGIATHIVEDETFAELFFNIWLHDASSDAKLRLQLFGVN